ncbi:MAG: hypothetical protein IT432_05370 [Phycisphaerales bacterium]|nr:hypothetical protein [Phycisphaerales bacterium]
MKVAAAAILAISASAVYAGPVDVTYSVSGSPGNWVLDFNVANNLNPSTMGLYFFGVELDTGRNIVGSPTNFDPNSWATWDNSGFGGSSTIYNNNWIDFNSNYTSILPGGSLSGFQALYTGPSAPTSVKFFCYANDPNGGQYNGTDNFNNQQNPGFEGIAHIPAPASLGVIGLAGVLASRRRR